MKLLAKELEILELENEISEKVQQNVNKGQRDYYLREQMHVIREELGEEDDEADSEGYQEKIRALMLPEETEAKLLKEARRLAKQQQNSAEAAVIRNYLDLVLELPWNTRTKERLDVKAAEKILDEDHFGLEPVKKRILETLAVRQLAPELPGQILCLVGPPGVGKSYLCIGVCNYFARQGSTCAFVNVPRLVSQLKRLFQDNEAMEELLAKIAKAKVVVFDDIGGESVTAWSRDDVLLPLLDERMNSHRLTYFTSNYTMAELQQRYSSLQAKKSDPVAALRLLERVKALSAEKMLKGRSRR